MVNTKMFYHPNYYKNLRKLARLRNRDQVISGANATAKVERAPGTGLKQQAIEETVPHNDIEEASSIKQQAHKVSSFKQQASSPKHKGSSLKPQASSSRILAPSKSFKHL